MKQLQFDFLGEEDFTAAMEGPCRTWRESSVIDSYFNSYDGARLHYYKAVHDKPLGCIVIVHGFGEFFGKYHEMAWYFYQAGYSVFFLEQRGQGYSERSASEMDVVDIDDYQTYVEDLRAFLDEIVIPEDKSPGRILYAHSMGGGIGAYFLEMYPDYFKYAILNAPMIKRKNNFPREMIYELEREMKETHTEKEMAPGQQHFSTIPDFEHSSALSRVRYEYAFNIRVNDIHCQTKVASKEWVVASERLHDAIIEGAGNIRTPITLFAAGRDHLIDDEGYREFAERVGNYLNIITFEESKHELFNSDEATRIKYLEVLFNIIDEAL